MTLQVIELDKFVPVDIRRDKGLCSVDSEPYTMAFCYLPNASILVKGLASSVRQFVDLLPPCNYYVSYWKNHQHRGWWQLNKAANEHYYLTRTGMANGRTGYNLYSRANQDKIISFRRMPRHCLKELVNLPATKRQERSMAMWNNFNRVFGQERLGANAYRQLYEGSFEYL